MSESPVHQIEWRDAETRFVDLNAHRGIDGQVFCSSTPGEVCITEAHRTGLRTVERKRSDLLRRITARPDVFGGKPIIRDMRISVEFILGLLAQGVTPEDILDDYPDLEPDDIRACTAYAHAVIARETLSAVTVVEL